MSHTKPAPSELKAARAPDACQPRDDLGTELSELINYLKTKIRYRHGSELEIGDVMFLITKGMSMLKKYKTLSGVEKKAVVIRAVQQTIKDVGTVPPHVEAFVDTALPPLIDAFYQVAKHRIRFKSGSWRCC